jgi:hypothetical protein
VIHRPLPSRPIRNLAAVRRRIGQALRARSNRQLSIADRRAGQRIIEAIGQVRSDASRWVVQGGRAGEPTILRVGLRGGPPAAIVRLVSTPAGRAGLERADTALQALRGRLAPAMNGILPEAITAGTLENRIWYAESALAGRSARALIGDPAARRRMLAATTMSIGAIHVATAGAALVDGALLERWIGRRAAAISEVLAPTPGAAADALARIAAAAAADLRGRILPLGWIHGDLWPANILVRGDPPTVAGIVDWDSAAEDELALHDRLHLALTTRRLVEHRDLGPVLADVLHGVPWGDDDRVVLDAAEGPPDGPAEGPADGFSGLSERTALWLYWLRFVEANLLRHPELATDRGWLAANVEQVLACA